MAAQFAAMVSYSVSRTQSESSTIIDAFRDMYLSQVESNRKKVGRFFVTVACEVGRHLRQPMPDRC